MGFIPRTNKGENGIRNDPFEELRDNIQQRLRDLLRIEVNRRSGRAGYKRTGISFDVLQPEEDDRELDSSAMAQQLLDAMVSDAEEQGREQLYQVVGFVKARGVKRTEERVILLMARLGPDDEDEPPDVAIDVLKMMSLVKQMLADVHARNLELTDKTIGLAKSVADIAQSSAEGSARNNATLIDALRMNLEFEERKQEREADVYMGEKNRDLIGRVVDTMGKPFADRFADVFGAAAENFFGVSKGALAQRLAKLLGSLTPEQRTEFERIVGTEVWLHLQDCAKAKDDEQFRAVFARVLAIWDRDRAAVNLQLTQLAKVLGTKIAGFVALLKDIGIQDEG